MSEFDRLSSLIHRFSLQVTPSQPGLPSLPLGASLELRGSLLDASLEASQIPQQDFPNKVPSQDSLAGFPQRSFLSKVFSA